MILCFSLGVKPDVQLSEYEMSIASQLVDPSTINVKFEDVAGEDHVLINQNTAIHVT